MLAGRGLTRVQGDRVGYPAAGGLVAAGGVAVGASFGGAGAGASGALVGASAEFDPGVFTGSSQSLRGKNPPGSGVRIGGRRCGRVGS